MRLKEQDGNGRCACDTNRINANWIAQMRNLPIIHWFDGISWPIGARNVSAHSHFTDGCWFPLIFSVAFLHRFDLRRVFINFKNEKCAYKWKRIECPDSVFIEWENKKLWKCIHTAIYKRAHTHIHAQIYFDSMQFTGWSNKIKRI